MYETIHFGDLTLSGTRPFLIAEAGVNYENDLEVAFRMVEEAASAGADAIKFQSYKAEKLASRHSPSYWDLSKESTESQFGLFKKYDHFNDEDFAALAKKAHECGIIFLSTPFDFHYADFLAPHMPVYKIASADLSNTPFLRYCAGKGKPIILSVGAATLAEVDEAVRIIRGEGNNNIALLHCVLSYPCKPEDANLKFIKRIESIFPDCIVGYSDHVPSDFGGLCLTTAWLLGARIIEKHFTLDKTKTGNDHYHAMDPEDIREFRRRCAYMTSLLGGNSKVVLACEMEARKQARRSLVAARHIKAGEIIGNEDIAIKRPGTGIEPKFLDLFVGARTIRDIHEDQLLQWDDFMRFGIEWPEVGERVLIERDQQHPDLLL